MNEVEFVAKIRGGTVRRGYKEPHVLAIFIPKVIAETHNLKKGTAVRVKMRKLR